MTLIPETLGARTRFGCVAALFAAAVAVSSPASPLQAQNATVVGVVTDAGTGQPLTAAQVYIPALNIGVTSRDGGRFVLPGVPAGTHELQVDLIGFVSVVRTIEAADGQTLTLDIQLHSTALELVEIVVTGTAFEESPVTLPYSVSVSGRRTLAEQGSPQATDFFKNLGASHGTLGERQGWYNTKQAGSMPETVANVNLRGLGSSRTLVLLNGRRQTYIPVRQYGGRFVDVNAFPSIAIDRIEVLKEGASAVYGSDAVAGVANFLTRGDFEGFEVEAAHEYFASSGNTNVGAIWGSPVGESSHAAVSAEVLVSQALNPQDRDWALRDFIAGAGSWSYTGNPGAFVLPQLTGDETGEEFADALVGAHFGGEGGVFVDPACQQFGGHIENETCRFRYQPWDDLQQSTRHVRAFGELNGDWGDEGSYHVEGLFAMATQPEWRTTPSYPPIYQYTDAWLVSPEHPGRMQFCNGGNLPSQFASQSECLADDWYFYGRLVGNSGPSRILSRQSTTQRLAASMERVIGELGGENLTLDVGASFSRAGGNVNIPSEYAYRKFLAFRGFGGPNCGVDVVLDTSTPSGMALGPLGGAVAGQGNCMYYNPFSNALQNSAQPGSAYESQANPDYNASLANSPELLDWINDEVDLEGTANLLVGDVMLKGTLAEGTANFAAGYQFRRFAVTGTPNTAGDLDVNPCPVLGDKSCVDKAGAFTFTNGFYPYDASQTVHRFFLEVPLTFGDRFSAQAAANYEFHSSASSFDPRLAMRLQIADPLALRVSVQTTFRTPSVDDVHPQQNTASAYVSEVGTYKATDTYGNPDLKPEQAFTYNAGLSLQLSRMRASVDYWAYDFSDMIELLPYSGIAAAYAGGGPARDVVQHLITCPGNRRDGSCDGRGIERIRLDMANWPGVTTSGVDWHVSTRMPAREGVVSLGMDGTYTRSYDVRELSVSSPTSPNLSVRLLDAQSAVGKLNWGSPIAPPLPRWKMRFSLGVHQGDYSLVNYMNTVSSYVNDAFEGTQYETVDGWRTWDLSLLRRSTGNLDVALSAMNLLDADPPFVAWEQNYDGFTHSARGRRIKLSATWRAGG